MRRKTYELSGHLHFVTFSVFGRRKLLETNKSKQIVLGDLSTQMHRFNAYCVGYVVMPEHVHALIGFHSKSQIALLMQEWKRKTSRVFKVIYMADESFLKELQTSSGQFRFWQPKYYDFLVRSLKKMNEKLVYIHNNPVNRKLVARSVDYKYSSARYYETGKTLGVKITRVDAS